MFFFNLPKFPELPNIVINRLGRKVPSYATDKIHLFTERYELNI